MFTSTCVSASSVRCFDVVNCEVMRWPTMFVNDQNHRRSLYGMHAIVLLEWGLDEGIAAETKKETLLERGVFATRCRY